MRWDGGDRRAGPPHGDARDDPSWDALTFRDLHERASVVRDAVDALLGALHRRITPDVRRNLAILRQRVGQSSDVIFRTFDIPGDPPRLAGVVYVEGLADAQQISGQVVRALTRHGIGRETSGARIARRLERHLLTVTQVKSDDRFDRLLQPVLAGDTALFVQGCERAFILGLRQFSHRGIEEPPTEAAIRGPREGFVEPLRINTSLIRRRLNTPALRIMNLHLGTRSKTEVAIVYLADVANPDLVLEVKRRLQAVSLDSVPEGGYLEQFIEDNHYSPFPQVMNTERPDKVVANLLEGRVAILTDGTPFALLVPTTFSMLYQAAEDYYERPDLASFIRLVRLISLIISLVLSSLYVSLVSFNPEMIPTKFAVAVAGGRAGVPVPAVVEVLLLETIMEILREASLHLPRQIGSAISIVGVLVIGQAAVASGFVSPITVVIVALSAIGSFATPAYNAASSLRMLRFLLIILAGMFGLYGVLVGLIFILNHMLSLESFGVPYMAPVAPLRWRGLRDTFVRAPLWLLRQRPRTTRPLDSVRIATRTADVVDEKWPVLDPARGQGGELP